MNFTEKYTTADIILKDKTDTENKKIQLSNDAYAIGEVLEKLFRKIDQGGLR